MHNGAGCDIGVLNVDQQIEAEDKCRDEGHVDDDGICYDT